MLRQLKNYPDGNSFTQKTVAWSFDKAGHAQKCVEWYCELANKKVEQLYKVSSPCLDDHEFKQEELESVGELSQVLFTNSLEMLALGSKSIHKMD